MANASLDHMLALTIFLAAILIFIGLFSSTIQTAVTYQQHNAISTKTSDLLDTLLLNPGLPANWSSLSDNLPWSLGLQDPEFSQYKLSAFSTMRVASTVQVPTYFPRAGVYYNNLTAGYGGFLLTPVTQTINYSTAAKLLGVNGTYGFQLTLTPTVTVAIEKTSTGTPLQFDVEVEGTGFALANASVTYSLVLVNQDAAEYPSYTILSGQTATDAAGSVPTLTFSGINGESRAYALIVYCHLYGLKGMGYYVHVPQSFTETVVPLVDSFQNRAVLLAHSDAVSQASPAYSLLSYNASFAIVTEEYTLRQVILDQAAAVGKVACGSVDQRNYTSIAVPDNSGILIVPYKDTSTGQVGVVLVPWGLGSLALPVTLGGNSAGYDWVTTDIRQVTIGGIAYQAKLALWNLEGGSG